MLKKVGLVVGTLCLIVSLISLYHFCFTKKIGYIDVPKVFNEFEMKKELEGKYKKVAELRKRVIDSLSFDLQLLSQKVNLAGNSDKDLIREFDLKRDYFFNTKNKLEEDNATLSSQYDKQILEQMSQYILEYGKKEGFDLILGAEGSGTVLYAKEDLNISQAVLEFINNKYKGVE